MNRFVIGIDYGTDSVRAVLVDSSNGKVQEEAVSEYPRWAEGKYSDSSANMFRHHPLDYIECLKTVFHGILDPNPEYASCVEGIGVDATGSTPCLVDESLVPLALRPEYEENPDAMFVLWKDHSSIREAEEIEAAGGEYLVATAGKCSPELYWPKLLHVLRHSPGLKKDAYTFLDLCTWVSNMLCGNSDPAKVKHSQSVVAAKFFEDPLKRTLPPREWFASIDDIWLDVVDHVHVGGNNGDEAYGTLCSDWASEFGLSTGVTVSCGMLDGFSGAVGVGISETRPVMVLGTSMGYLTVSNDCSRLVRGAFTQGVGQTLPGKFCVEMGMSAFGDIFAWFARLLKFMAPDGVSNGEVLRRLGEQASALPDGGRRVIATDFFNGRRSPDLNNGIRAVIAGLDLGVSAPEIYRALVEASCYGVRAIIERMTESGMAPDEVMCIGGISQKSPYLMQVLADVTGVPVKVSDCLQSCALGAAMCAATACGIHSTIYDAQKAMAAGVSASYNPDRQRKAVFDAGYAAYTALTRATTP